MKKTINSIIALCLVAILAISCKSTNQTTTAAKIPVKEKKLANSLLWKISGNDLEKPSYLFGTIHLTCNYNLSDKVKNAFAATDQVALEVDMDDPQMQLKAMQSMMMKDNKSIKDMLSEEEYKKLNDYFIKNVGMGVAMFNKAKPFTLMSMLMLKSTNCDAPKSYEQEFLKIAKAANEDVLGLETIESQFAIFDDIPYEDQLAEVMKLVNDAEASKKEFAKLSELHTAENIEGLLNIMETQEGMTKDFSDKLLDNRNKNWIPVIEKMSKEKPTFYGVGAMHLAGENGVIKLLRKAGYTVEAVN